jgi:hypothetical protein
MRILDSQGFPLNFLLVDDEILNMDQELDVTQDPDQMFKGDILLSDFRELLSLLPY